jgi:hypothetical protein
VEKIEWSDLQLVVNQDVIAHSYGLWSDVTGTQIKPLFISTFGDLFYVATDLKVHHLDLLGLTVWPLEITEQDFTKFLNYPTTITDKLHSELILDLKVRDIKRLPHQVYALVPHPIFVGILTADRAIAMDLFPWSSLCKQLYTGM